MTTSFSVILRLALIVSLSTCQQMSPALQPPQEPSQPQPQPNQAQQPATSVETSKAPASASANGTNGTNGEVEAPRCFYEPASSCANITGHIRCRALPHLPGAVLCCDLENNHTIRKGLTNAGIPMSAIEFLHLRNVTIPVLDVGTGTYWDELVSLRQLAITEGSVTVLQGRLRTQQLNCMNLSANALTQLPNVSASTVSRLWLDITGNNGLACHGILEMMNETREASNNKTELQFVYSNKTYCLSSQSFHWFNSTERVPLEQVEALNRLAKQCPSFPSGRCTCTHAGIDMVAGKSPTYSVQVDCSGRGLIELPDELPPNTIMLNVSDNRISNITRLSVFPTYKGIRRFYADNNTITSMDRLEGSQFIENFVELSLRSNNISEIPTYILSSAFDRIQDGRTVNLGQNRLKCDCSTAQTIKFWLINHKKQISDYYEVLCENMPCPVVELDQNKLCVVPSDWKDYIYYIIAGEVALLFLLIFKVSYDYWVFKTAGYLPWPASKMPKLPCDWVFE